MAASGFGAKMNAMIKRIGALILSLTFFLPSARGAENNSSSEPTSKKTDYRKVSDVRAETFTASDVTAYVSRRTDDGMTPLEPA